MITKEQLSEQSLAKEMQDITRRIDVDDIDEALFFPKYFQIETTRLCNARCPFCAIDQWDKTTTFMSDDLFSKIVKEMKEFADWIEVVNVQRAGEPLIDKKIIERVRAFKEIGIKSVNISTNASLLNEARATKLIEAGIDEVMLSIDSVDKEPYEKMRVGLKYETVIDNIKRFFRLREKLNPKVIIRVRGVSFYDINNEKHRKELQRWEDFWNKNKKPQDRIYMKRAHNWGNQKIWDGHKDKMEPVNEIFHPCVLPWSTMHVTAMGIVPLCPQDYDATMNIGDINKQTIAEVWKGENWNRIRNLHATGQRNDIELCKGCKLFDLDFKLENWQQIQLWEG